MGLLRIFLGGKLDVLTVPMQDMIKVLPADAVTALETIEDPNAHNEKLMQRMEAEWQMRKGVHESR